MFPLSPLPKNAGSEVRPIAAGQASPDRRLLVFSAAHFAVDLACIFLMSAIAFPQSLNKAPWALCVLTYNFFAFAVQLPVGAICDVSKKPRELAAFGCALVSLAFLIARFTQAPVLTGIVAGIGNSCFHVGGGVDTLNQSGGRAERPGIFVATGAFGVYLARKLAGLPGVSAVGTAAGVVLMMMCAYAIASLGRSEEQEGGHLEARQALASDGQADVPARTAAVCGALLFLTVLFRSYCGYLMAWGWKAALLPGLLFTCGVVCGKMAGGVVGDRIGWGKSSAVSLALAAVLFLFAPSSAACGIIGVFLFNMTMPITLTALARMMGRELYGTAFGITTFALFIGTVPSTIGMPASLVSPPSWLLIVLTALSLAAILGGIAPLRGKRDHE